MPPFDARPHTFAYTGQLTAVQGLREIVRPGENGRLARPGDAEALAEAVADAIADWPATRASAENALVEASQRYSPEQYRKAVAGALESLTASLTATTGR